MVRSVMGLFRRGQRRGPEDDEAAARFDAAASAAARLRGENLTPMPADDTATSIDNVSAAARDYGLSRFSGESDALGRASKSYRPATKRRRRHRR